MKKLKIRNVVLFILTFIGISGIVLGLDLTFNKPTTLNKIIASKIYKEPANKAFTDQNFYNCVVDAYNKTNSTSVAYTENLTDEQLQTITSLNCSGYGKETNEQIQNTSGLEKLINLTYLDVFYNQLTELDVNNNPELTDLDAYVNSLTNLDVSNNPELTNLNVGYNDLTNLDVSTNTKLTDLSVSGNQLTNLDVSNNPELTDLWVDNNELTNLDVSNNPELTDLWVDNNELTNLDVSNNTKLKVFVVGSNQLTEVDVSTNTKLTYLNVYGNQLTELDVSNNTKLMAFVVGSNQLTEVDVSTNTKLTSLNVSDNQLTELDVSNNPELIDLNVSDNQLTELDVSNNPELTDLNVYNNQLTEVDVSNNPELTSLWVHKNQLTELDVSTNTKLHQLVVDNNQLALLDVSNNPELIDLRASNNQLALLDVSNNPELTALIVSNNPFSIDFCIYKGSTKSIDESIKLPLTLFEGKTSALEELTSDNQEVTIADNNITINETGKYEIKAEYIHNISSSNNSYTVTYNFNVIEAISEKYNIGQDYIYVGTETNDQIILENIKINGYIEGITTTIEDNTLTIKYQENVLYTYEIIGIDFGTLEVNNKMILMLEDITYEDFISNITTAGVTYKIFNGEEEVTSGTLTKGMILKVYKDNEEIDSYEITDEYLDLSLLEVDEEKKLIKELILGTSISELKEKILTSGEVTIKDKDGKDLSDSDIVRSGAVVTIELSKETYEYTLSVKGDTTGDGVSSVADVGKLYQYLKGKITMEDCYIEAGNVVGEEIEIKVNDVGKLYQYIKGKISSLEE